MTDNLIAKSPEHTCPNCGAPCDCDDYDDDTTPCGHDCVNHDWSNDEANHAKENNS